MKKPDEYYQSLIIEYFLGNLEEEALRELTEWVFADRQHRQFFQEEIKKYHSIQSLEYWDTLDTSLARERVFRKLHQPRLLIRIAAYAACLAVLLSATFFLYQYQENRAVRNNFPSYSSAPTLADRHRALLSIDNEQPIRLMGKEKIILSADQRNRVLLADSNVIDYSRIENQPEEKVALHTLEVPKGCEFNVILSDGTHIWMNAGSVLTYPEYFRGNSREVSLSGEAYFEVTPDPQAPFRVKTQEMQLTVLGTSFNVKAYPEDEALTTTLVTGKIRQTYPALEKDIVLQPEEQAVYTKEGHVLQIQTVNVRDAMAWKEGRIVMKNKTLKEIFTELSRWYDFDVDYRQEQLKEIRFYLNMNRYDDIRTVLAKLQKTNGVKFMFQGRKVVVYENAND